MMILEFDNNPNIPFERRLQSFKESVQRALEMCAVDAIAAEDIDRICVPDLTRNNLIGINLASGNSGGTFLDEEGLDRLWRIIKAYTDNAANGRLPLTGGTLTGELALKSNLRVKGSMYLSDNGGIIYGTGTDGKVRSLIYMSSNNNTVIGYGGYYDSIGKTDIYGNEIQMHTKTGGLTVNGTEVSMSGHSHDSLKTNDVYAVRLTSDSDGYYLRPNGVTGYLGTVSYPWEVVNANVLRTYSTATTSNGVAARIYENRIYRASSSSERYKHDIAPIIADEIAPERLYEAEVVQFKYSEGYLIDKDSRHDKLIPGFIVEKLKEVYPIAVDYNDEGLPEMWNANIMLPPMLKLIQDLNSRVLILENN